MKNQSSNARPIKRKTKKPKTIVIKYSYFGTFYISSKLGLIATASTWALYVFVGRGPDYILEEWEMVLLFLFLDAICLWMLYKSVIVIPKNWGNAMVIDRLGIRWLLPTGSGFVNWSDLISCKAWPIPRSLHVHLVFKVKDPKPYLKSLPLLLRPIHWLNSNLVGSPVYFPTVYLRASPFDLEWDINTYLSKMQRSESDAFGELVEELEKQLTEKEKARIRKTGLRTLVTKILAKRGSHQRP